MTRKIFLLLLLSPLLLQVSAQKNPPKKYPSLLWEITGNGLKKPSYLFGTMHVSSKMAFHLSDSFYYAIKNVDAVALELNPDTWQGQMVRLDQQKLNYSNYLQAHRGNYMTEKSFRLTDYTDQIKLALSTEPAVVNSLLYRSYKPREDFEEDTFLDLYIFQTGRKLGKRGTGVENYYETEKIVIQAYGDMAAEKKKKTIDTDGESMADISEKIEDAYKRGDLDLMDSLDNMIERSPAFREKFLYYRNEIQANSIDSIIKKSSLFVGVGSAHLPGARGVIELLRKKGYKLRPVKMADRNAAQKETIDKLKVPVIFSTMQSEDGFYKVDAPGPLFDVYEEYNTLDRQQYSDMSNGSYYQVTRVKTHASFLNQDEELVKKRIDSLLYENVPGKILKKNSIVRYGYPGFDITSRTRRGDMQRYHIYVTPFEVVIFKMSGKENYISGKEGEQFFSSIVLKERNNNSITYTPPQGGFSVKLPHQPTVHYNTYSKDNINTWEFEAQNKTTGNAYLVLKKSLYNFNFLDEDTFELKLMEESFRAPDFFERQLQRKVSSFNGYPCLDVQEKMKDSSIVTARYIIKGPHYYTLAVRSKAPAENDELFQSFSFTPFNYGPSNNFEDSFLHFTVATPVAPAIDTSYRAVLEKAAKDAKSSYDYGSGFMGDNRTATFKSDSTGEMIYVNSQKLQDYYYARDSADFWKSQIDELAAENQMVLYKKEALEKSNGIKGYALTLRDTASSRTIQANLLLKKNYLFTISTMGDTLNHASTFVTGFFNSFAPDAYIKGRDIFTSPLDSFFTHLFSTDSATQAKAQQSISYLYYGESGVPKIMEALKKLTPDNKNYFEIKTKLIAELGYIKDSTKPVVVSHLKQLYQQAGDTSMFQNEVIEALARHRTQAATDAFKELVLQDPPVFDNDYSYENLFNTYEDTLQLATQLFPDILQLTSLDDYKEPVMNLLVTLVDSGFVKPSQYESWFSKIFFDAKIELKKQRGSDEKKMEAENKRKIAPDEDEENDYSYSSGSSDYSDELKDYATLLFPFYNQNNNVPRFFEKLLQSKEEDVKQNTAMILLHNNQPVADSILTNLASTDKQRASLFRALKKIKQENKFPARYKTQIDLARSCMVEDKSYNKIDSIVMVGKQAAACNNKKGNVYFFKYRVKKDDDWKIGISGLQPENEQEISGGDEVVSMTDKKLKDDKPESEQFAEQLKKLLYNFHPSAKYYFDNDRYNYNYRF